MHKQVTSSAALLNCTVPVNLSSFGFGGDSGADLGDEQESRRPGSLPMTATFKAEIAYDGIC